MCLWRIRVAASKSYIRGKKNTNKQEEKVFKSYLKELSVDWYSKSSKEPLNNKEMKLYIHCTCNIITVSNWSAIIYARSVTYISWQSLQKIIKLLVSASTNFFTLSPVVGSCMANKNYESTSMNQLVLNIINKQWQCNGQSSILIKLLDRALIQVVWVQALGDVG